MSEFFFFFFRVALTIVIIIVIISIRLITGQSSLSCLRCHQSQLLWSQNWKSKINSKIIQFNSIKRDGQRDRGNQKFRFLTFFMSEKRNVTTFRNHKLKTRLNTDQSYIRPLPLPCHISVLKMFSFFFFFISLRQIIKRSKIS